MLILLLIKGHTNQDAFIDKMGTISESMFGQIVLKALPSTSREKASWIKYSEDKLKEKKIKLYSIYLLTWRFQVQKHTPKEYWQKKNV